MFLTVHVILMLVTMLIFTSEVIMVMFMCNHMSVRHSIMSMNNRMCWDGIGYIITSFKNVNIPPIYFVPF